MARGRLLIPLLAVGCAVAEAGRMSPEEHGRALFEHEWTVDDPLSSGGDGLGPVYNATSCVACHNQGGVGGAGDRTADVEQRVLGNSTTVLHKHGVDDGYQDWRRKQAGGQLVRRNTPALFGLGLIDGISESAIHANLQGQASDVRGRAGVVEGGGTGRFGWKGDIPSVDAFVRQACAMELGLTNASHAAPADPSRKGTYEPEPDMTEEQIGFLTQFVKKLKRPKDVPEHDGRELFHEAGCVECHTADLDGVEGLYSDLALHDLGQGLASVGGSYGSRAPSLAQARLWRTPPLWGVADSAPYLHDGRADTLYEAIRMHGGQAQRASSAFLVMTPEEQATLQHFLLSLEAPDVD